MSERVKTLVTEKRHEEQILDSLEQAGRQFLRAYRNRQDASKIRYAFRMFSELYIARVRDGDQLTPPWWQPSPRGTATGWGKEIQWVAKVLDELDNRRKVM